MTNSEPQLLAKFRTEVVDLTITEREQIVDAAYLIIDRLYAHLLFKQTIYGLDPLQKLRILKSQLKQLSERQFHNELISFFADFRDLHTTYRLPEPFATLEAYLPFIVEECFENNIPHYYVTRVFDVEDSNFKIGAEITYWNGTPMALAIELNAARLGGSNPEARRARGVQMMTFRPLFFTLLPDEDWVVVRYWDGDQERTTSFNWMVWDVTLIQKAAASGNLKSLEIDPDALDHPASRLLGIDLVSQIVKSTQQMLSDRSQTAPATQSGIPSNLPLYFTAKTVQTPSGTFAYIKIVQFNIQDADSFLQEFIRLLDLVPQNGLILDLRGNQGGNIAAGELCLQVLTPNRIETEGFMFRSTPTTELLTKRDEPLTLWNESIQSASMTGSIYSRVFPIDPSSDCNEIGQRYYGPVLLIVDALCYSTAEIFCAGFQDHQIGPILGTSNRTGAGGGNVWSYQQLMAAVNEDAIFKPLPRNASFTVALRRSIRVRDNSGVPVEDLGVSPDYIHHLTRADLLHDSVDLLARAGEILASLPVVALKATVTGTDSRRIQVTVTINGFSRLDIYIDKHPYTSIELAQDKLDLDLPLLAPGAHVLEFQGFKEDQLVAASRIAYNSSASDTKAG